uniref:Uncharacterized protein n=1 Tax=Moniliophthora roreri TaxID=221103 RepID=A0A0W0EU98_MONRR
MALHGSLRRPSLQRSLLNDALQIVVAETDFWSLWYSVMDEMNVSTSGWLCSEHLELVGEGRAFQCDHTTLLPLTSGFHLVEDVTSSSPSLVRSNKEHFRAAIHPHRLPYAGSSVNGSISTTARALYFVASLFEQGI